MPKNLSVVLSFTGACEESIAGVDYWITRILVERGGWFKLEKNYERRRPGSWRREGYDVLPALKLERSLPIFFLGWFKRLLNRETLRTTKSLKLLKRSRTIFLNKYPAPTKNSEKN